MITKDKIIKLFIEELECKKEYKAKWRTTCSQCEEVVNEGDAIYFVGDGRLVCDECMGDIIDILEEY